MEQMKGIRFEKLFFWTIIFTIFVNANVDAQGSHFTGIKGLTNAQKKLLLDSDGDGLPDTIERQLKLNPRSRDTNNDGIADGESDANYNGIPDGREFQEGKFDTDGDGLSDADERALRTDPYNPDTNGNGIPDGQEKGTYRSLTSRSEEGGEGNEGSDSEDGGSSQVHNQAPVKSSRPIVKQNTPVKIPPCKTSRQKKCYQQPKSPAGTKTPSAKPTVSTPVGGGTTKSPTPIPTVATPAGNYDSNGNTTKFGIPAGLSGNINSGGSIWASNCSGCHGSEKSNRGYGQIKGSMSIPAMSGLRMSDSQLADLVAYLNRSQK